MERIRNPGSADRDNINLFKGVNTVVFIIKNKNKSLFFIINLVKLS